MSLQQPTEHKRQGMFSRTMVCAVLVWTAMALALPAIVRAAAQEQAEDPENSAPVTAPVIVEGDEILRVRGTSALPPERRANGIAGRIVDLAADRSVKVEYLELVESPTMTLIRTRDRIIMGVTNADSAIEHVDRQTLARTYLESIKTAVIRYRDDRSPRVLLKNSAYALGAAGFLALALFVIARAFRLLERLIGKRLGSEMKHPRLRVFRVVQEEKLWASIRAGLRALRILVTVILCLFCVNFVGSLYPWTRPIAKRGLSLLLEPVRTIAGAVLASVPNLLFIAILILIIRYLLKLSRLFFAGVDQGRFAIPGFDSEWAMPTYKIVRVLVIGFGAVVAYPYIPGSQSEAFKGVSIFAGIVFSLGSTSAVANVIAGYLLTYRRAFKVGDRIKLMDLMGDVVQVRLEVTHLRSIKNEEIIVPNSQILNSNVINYSSLARDRGLILHTTVGIGYEVPWRQVESMLLIAAERTPGLLREPRPFVLLNKLGEFCITYEINVYCSRPQEGMLLYSVLHRNILDVFNEYGVQIMVPAYEGDTEKAKVVPKEKWFTNPAQMSETR